MAKKARQRISYVLENEKASAGGHRLGVNGLAVDEFNNILYSGGRDGVVCAWDMNSEAATGLNPSGPRPSPAARFRAQTQAHMHWVNDIALAQKNTAIVSASSDQSVKIWRPYSQEDNLRAQTIGEHADYVKCVATPPADIGANWVASGGLDRKISLWDLNGGGKTLEIEATGEDVAEKGSIYALHAGRNILAAGGPEKMVRLYDPRSGDKVSKLVGHVDVIRSILVDDSGDIILSAAADKTIKMWSVKGGRCMYTFTMHDTSVWSLYSSDPTLGVFYSCDRDGLVVKTDVRGSLEDIDDGLSLAVAREHSGICRVVASGGYIWTATNQSSINRWKDVDTRADSLLPQPFRRQRGVSNASQQTTSSSSNAAPGKEISPDSILRISNTAAFPLRSAFDPDHNVFADGMARKPSEVVMDPPATEVKPVYELPVETIEGQFGLLKHKLLNDRRRVLTLDTAGDVLLWDLVKGKPIQSFGKQHLEDVEIVVNTREAVAPWCTVDLSSGNLTVVLEPYNCFDAEVYADELELEERIDFREDQRISLGRWILRYLFANLIDEEIKRDETYRRKINEAIDAKRAEGGRANAPTSISIPTTTMSNWETSDQTSTPRANGGRFSPITPGLAIGLATPAPQSTLPGVPEGAVPSPLSPVETRSSAVNRSTGDREDYFTSAIGPVDSNTGKTATTVVPAQATPSAEAADPKSPIDNGTDKGGKDKDKGADAAKSPTTAFGKKFRMFGSKKVGRSASQTAPERPVVVVDEKAEGSESSSVHEKEVDDSFFGVIQKIRQEYEKQQAEASDRHVETQITPSLPSETPVLKFPPSTKVIIQEETSGGSANVYQGTVETVGRDADIIEQKAPMWLGDVLLQNQIPLKDPVKISFVLHPLGDLPAISSTDGNNRLNANRMLRVRKILAYVTERMEVQPEEPEPDALRPDEYMELYCNDQLLEPTTTLATLRTHVWKGGSDIVLYYKANGRKEIKLAPPSPAAPETQEPPAVGVTNTADGTTTQTT